MDRPRSGRPTVLSRRTVGRILFLTTERVPVEATHWSTRLMARYAGVTQWQVRKVWQAADVKPHWLKTFKRVHPRACGGNRLSMAQKLSMPWKWQPEKGPLCL